MKLETKFHPAALDRIADQSRGASTAPTAQDLGLMAADTIALADELSPDPAQAQASIAGACQTIEQLRPKK